MNSILVGSLFAIVFIVGVIIIVWYMCPARFNYCRKAPDTEDIDIFKSVAHINVTSDLFSIGDVDDESEDEIYTSNA